MAKKNKAGRSSIPDAERKVQSYYYTKKKNKKKIAEEVKKIVIALDN